MGGVGGASADHLSAETCGGSSRIADACDFRGLRAAGVLEPTADCERRRFERRPVAAAGAARERHPDAGRRRLYRRPVGRHDHEAQRQSARAPPHGYSRRLAVLVVDAGTDLSAALQYMAAIKRPVTVIGTSCGTLRAAYGIARGARPDALVLTSGFLAPESGSGENVASILGSPAALPRTLVIEHREDGCRFTQPAGVDPFIRCAGGRARAVWLSGGVNEGDACEAQGHHGFNGLDGQVVSLAAGFR